MKLRSLLPGVSFCLIAFACSYAQQTAPTAAQIAQQELQRATALLSLTADQQTAALAIFTAEATSEVALEATGSALNKTLDTAITSGDVSGITTTAASIGTLQGQLTALHANAEEKLYQLLTSDQQSKFAALLEAQIGIGGPGGPGGSGGPGGTGGPGAPPQQ